MGLAGNVINDVPDVLVPAATDEVLLRCSMQHTDVHGQVDLASPAVVGSCPKAGQNAMGFTNVACGMVCMDIFHTKCLQKQVKKRGLCVFAISLQLLKVPVRFVLQIFLLFKT